MATKLVGLRGLEKKSHEQRLEVFCPLFIRAKEVKLSGDLVETYIKILTHW